MKHVLALDGGGMRGYFTYHLLLQIQKHIKGDQPFHEYFDLVVGTSAGAFVGAAVACGLFSHPDQLELMVQDSFNVFGTKNECQPLFAPIYTGVEKKRILNRYFGSYKMSDCKIPFAAVTTTSNWQKRVFASWIDKDISLADVLDASSAVPSYFPPVNINDQWYLDGGIVSNCPVDVAVTHIRMLTDQPFRILNIGNRTYEHHKIEIKHPQKVGFVALLKLGLVDGLLGLHNASMIDVVKVMCSPSECSILRVTGQIEPKFDDISPEFQLFLYEEAHRVWKQNEGELLAFFHS